MISLPIKTSATIIIMIRLVRVVRSGSRFQRIRIVAMAQTVQHHGCSDIGIRRMLRSKARESRAIPIKLRIVSIQGPELGNISEAPTVTRISGMLRPSPKINSIKLARYALGAWVLYVRAAKKLGVAHGDTIKTEAMPRAKVWELLLGLRL